MFTRLITIIISAMFGFASCATISNFRVSFRDSCMDVAEKSFNELQKKYVCLKAVTAPQLIAISPGVLPSAFIGTVCANGVYGFLFMNENDAGLVKAIKEAEESVEIRQCKMIDPNTHIGYPYTIIWVKLNNKTREANTTTDGEGDQKS